MGRVSKSEYCAEVRPDKETFCVLGFFLLSLIQLFLKCFEVQNMGHRSLFYQYRKYPKHLQKLTLGLIRPKVSFYKCLGYFLY